MRMINLRNDRNSWKMRSTRITRSIRNTLSEGMSESMYCRIACTMQTTTMKQSMRSPALIDSKLCSDLATMTTSS